MRLDSKTFEGLTKKGIIDSRFNFYSDFRWNRKLIEQISTRISNQKNSDSDIEKLNIILKKALDFESGIIAYSD